MKKVYNKSKRTNYKGSIPGMKMGGGLTKARYGLPRAQDGYVPTKTDNKMEQDITDFSTINADDAWKERELTGEELLMQQIENRKKEIGAMMDQEVENQYLNANISDSLYRDHKMKQQLQGLNTEFDDLSGTTEFQKLEAACMRGDASACAAIKAQGLSKEDLLTKNLHNSSKFTREYELDDEGYNRKDFDQLGFQPANRVLDSDEIKNIVPNINYKKGGTVKKKRGGTVLGGKYKMKKGGSTGRNGIL